MCYEVRFFKSWAKQKSQSREDARPEDVRARPDVQRIGPAPNREIAHRKDVEREFEEIV